MRFQSTHGGTKNADGTIFSKDREEKCKQVTLGVFKALYVQGTEVKFVKHLLILLKQQINRFLEHKNSQVKN